MEINRSNSIFENVHFQEVATYDKARKALENIVGDSYDISYSDFVTMKVGTAEFVTIKATITVHTADGKHIKREYVNTNEIMKNEKGAPTNLSMSIDRCEKEAFRRCVSSEFFHMIEDQKTRSNPVSKEPTLAENPTIASLMQKRIQKAEPDSMEVEVVFTSPFEQLQPASRYTDSYRCFGTCDGEDVNIVVWYSATQLLKRKGIWDDFRALYVLKTPVKVIAEANFYRGNRQLVIKDVVSMAP